LEIDPIAAARKLALATPHPCVPAGRFPRFEREIDTAFGSFKSGADASRRAT